MSATITYFPFDEGAGSVSMENRWGYMMQNLLCNGVIIQGSSLGSTDNCAVAPDTGRQIQIYAGKAWIRGFMFSHTDDPYTLMISENTSGDPRIDLVTIRLDTDANTIAYNVIEGTPDPSPVPPDPFANDVTWDLPIAQVYVADGATEILAADITDLRVSANHATFRPTCIVSRTTAQTITDTSEDPIEWDEKILDNMNMNWDSMNPERIYIRETGIYDIKASAAWERDDAVGDTVALTIYKVSGMTTTAIARDVIKPYAATGITLDPVVSCAAIESCETDDYIYVAARNESGTSLDILSNDFYSPRCSLVKVGQAEGEVYF